MYFFPMPAKLSTPKRLQHISTIGRARLPGDGGQHARRLALAWPHTRHQPHTAGQATATSCSTSTKEKSRFKGLHLEKNK
jgi:hypothetical protein